MLRGKDTRFERLQGPDLELVSIVLVVALELGIDARSVVGQRRTSGVGEKDHAIAGWAGREQKPPCQRQATLVCGGNERRLAELRQTYQELGANLLHELDDR